MNNQNIIIENIILNIINDINSFTLTYTDYYEKKKCPNWMNELFNRIKNHEFSFTKLHPDLYDMYKVFIINEYINNKIKIVDIDYIKSTYFV